MDPVDVSQLPQHSLVVPRYLVMKGGICTDKQKAIGDLALIAFYYLLRVGEYTYHKQAKKRRSKQFRVSDIALWADNKNTPKPNITHSIPLYSLHSRNTKHFQSEN